MKNFPRLDYVTTALKTTYPPGLEVTAYKANCISRAHQFTSSKDPLREHTGPNIHKLNNIALENLEAPSELNYPEFYFEIDTQEDFLMLSALIQLVLNQYGSKFTTQNLIEIAKQNPGIIEINTKVHRRWKAFRTK